MAKKTILISGHASMGVVVDDSHPDFNNDDMLKERGVDIWRNAIKNLVGTGLQLESKPHIEIE